MQQLEFNLAGSPLTAAELGGLRSMAGAAMRRRRYADRGWLILSVLCGIAAALWLGYSGATDPQWAATVPDPAARLILTILLPLALGMLATSASLTAGLLLNAFLARGAADARVEHALAELNPQTMPEACIKFAEFCRTNETVRGFQHQLAAKGRMPVQGEYEAARRLVSQDQAQRACAAMQQPIQD